MGSGGVSPRPPPSGPSGYWMINVCWLIAIQAAAAGAAGVAGQLC